MPTQSRLPAFLLTRPKVQSLRFEAELRQAFGPGFVITISPIIAPVLLRAECPKGPFAAVIFTSQTGVQACKLLMEQGFDLPDLAYCVGERTAQAAQELDFRTLSANGDAQALVALIVASPPTGPLLHLRGAESRGAIAETLQNAGIETISTAIYRQDPQVLTPEAIILLGGQGPVVVLLFSPRSAALFSGQAQSCDLHAKLTCISLSSAIDAEIKNGLICDRHVAARPTAEAMIAKIAALFAATNAT
jgi:uroporphyrinogen-III synthase